ncbi:MAG TPA: Coq4 family protein [Allosphingosinicella sp.]|nr:Coq4 family protein [Allosphingosinicella sp.]
MLTPVDRTFGESFLRSVDDFYGYGVHLLFNDWWETAPREVIDKYVAALEADPELSALAHGQWYAPPLDLAQLDNYPDGTLGQAYRDFMRSNNLMERLAEGYRELHEQFSADGRLDRMPPILKYKVLRGYQTHDLHHVLTGYPATPFGELGLQAFQLAQVEFPYAAMWIAVVTGHMAFVDPNLIKPAMDAISHGWSYGREARSIQFIKFEQRLDQPLEEVRREFRLGRDCRRVAATPVTPPELVAAASI